MLSQKNRRRLYALLCALLLIQPGVPAVHAANPGSVVNVGDETTNAEGEAAGAEDEAAGAEDEAADAEDEAADVEDEAAGAEDEAADVEDEAANVEDEAVSTEDTEESDSSVTLKNGTAVIPAGSDLSAVKEALAQALVADPDSIDPQSLEWEYYCEGKTKIGTWGNRSWGSIEGFTTETGKYIKTQYVHPALVDNGDDDFQVRIAGTSDEVTLTRLSEAPRQESAIHLNDGLYVVPMIYTEFGDIDYSATEQAVLAAVVAGTEPEGMAVAVAYNAKNVSLGGSESWKSLGHQPGTLDNTRAFGVGTWSIRLSFDATEGYTAAEEVVTVEMTARSEAPIQFAEGAVALTYGEDLSVDYAALTDGIRAMFTSEAVDLSDAALEYYATAKSGSVGGLGKNWAPLTGGKVSGLDYPAIDEGTHQVRLIWGGNGQYAPTTVVGTVTVTGREKVRFTLNDAPYEVGMVFNADQGFDYEATARAIYDAVVASTAPEVAYENMKLEFTTTSDVLGANFKPLDHQGATGLLDFKDGTWKIRVSCGDTVDYRGNSVTVEVTIVDSRIQGVVALKEGASFTYNMDPAVMKQAIFDQVIDWENSTLPAGADISAFEILYKAQMDVLDDSVDADKLGSLIGKIPGMENAGGSIGDIVGSLGDSTKRFMPIEGGKYMGISYVPMGAGEQQVQVIFKGDAEYRPSDAAETSVTVNKANVKVKVKSASVYADQGLPEGFITTDPADQFEFYTIYAGATSNVNLGIYVDLPDKFDNNTMIKLIDPLVEKIAGRSFTQMLQDGVTLGELRQLFTNTELLELLEKVGVDTGSFGQMLKVISSLPSATDGIRIGFGIPNRAGLYTVTAVSDNKNYNTGVGVGALVVRMRASGVKLTWNQDLGSKISAADAKTFDFGATLSYDGDVTVNQSGVHYLYSGFTSKWKPYSSTTTPPTEPGRYVVTVVTLGGNYQAAPITRSFQITK